MQSEFKVQPRDQKILQINLDFLPAIMCVYVNLKYVGKHHSKVGIMPHMLWLIGGRFGVAARKRRKTPILNVGGETKCIRFILTFSYQ